MLCVLRQVVGDGEQGALEPTKMCRLGRMLGDLQGFQGDVDEGAVADHRIEQRAARLQCVSLALSSP